MKGIIAFILLLITLTAVFTPCCGYDDCNETAVVMNEHPDEETGENCSPFVACGYCPGFTQLNATEEIPVLMPPPIAHCSKEIGWHSSSYSDRLLQPPRAV